MGKELLMELLEVVKRGKADIEKEINETAEEYATLMMIKTHEEFEGEELEALNVAIISLLVKGSIAKATANAIDREIITLKNTIADL